MVVCVDVRVGADSIGAERTTMFTGKTMASK